MKNIDRIKSIADLNKQIADLNKQIEAINAQYIKANTTFKKNDLIEFIEKGDSYNSEPDEYHTGKICSFEIHSDGEIIVHAGNHQRPRIKDIRLIDPDNYEFRDKVYGIPELEIGDEFYVISPKPKTTIGKKYKVYKKVQDGDSVEYWFYNDSDKPQTLYNGEYRTII